MLLFVEALDFLRFPDQPGAGRQRSQQGGAGLRQLIITVCFPVVISSGNTCPTRMAMSVTTETASVAPPRAGAAAGKKKGGGGVSCRGRNAGMLQTGISEASLYDSVAIHEQVASQAQVGQTPRLVRRCVGVIRGQVRGDAQLFEINEVWTKKKDFEIRLSSSSFGGPTQKSVPLRQQ